MKCRSIFLKSIFVLAANVFAVEGIRADSEPTIGLGVSLGANSGLSGYFDLSRGNFIQSVIAMNRYDGYSVSVDYAFKKKAFNSTMFDYYYGVGGVVGHSAYFWTIRDRERWAKKEYFGLRIPVGLLFWVPNLPIQVAPEIAPTIILGASTIVTIDPSLALRVVF